MAKKLKKTDEALSMLSSSDSDENDDSGADSVDSVLEDAFLHGEDALLDWEYSPRKRKISKPNTWRDTEQLESWHGPEDKDQEPHRFSFVPRRTPGAQLDPHSNYSPLEIFKLFFTKDVLHTLCINTNKYAHYRHTKGSKQSWVGVDPEEMLRYMSVVIYMGLVKTSHALDLWRTDSLHQLPFPSSVMSGSRFAAISNFLHMSDPDHDQVNDQLKGTPQYDSLCRLKPLHDDIKTACMAFYHPFGNISIDERMVACKGRHSLKQYIKDKPTKWGFKLFVLADSLTGYTCNFTVYQGKSLSPSGKGLGFDAVMDLLPVNSIGTGYTLYVDNFYTSSALFAHLHSMNIGACGTIRENRIDVPKNRPNELPKNAKRGDMRWIREGPLLFVKWKDTREVSLCSTVHRAFSGKVVKRNQKKADGTWDKQPIPVPDPIIDYNKYMGGVDLSDALIKFFSVARKTMKWYKKFFYHFIDIAVVNSYIISKERAKVKKVKILTHKQFREYLCKQLSECGKMEKPAPKVVPVPKDEEEVPCFPVTITNVDKVDSRDRATLGRKYCFHCKKNKTIYKCRNCDVPLCIVVDRICFTAWHDLKKQDTTKDR